MKFSSREDIEAPIDAVFGMVSDFEALERGAVRCGTDVRRTDGLTATGPGMTWDAAFDMHGRRRHVTLTLVTCEAPAELAVEAVSQGLSGHFVVELQALSRSRTRLAVGLELTPKTVPGRLVIQSLRLAKPRLNTRFKQRVSDYARHMEELYGRRA